MKTPEGITQNVLDGMVGIGGCPSNEEFYAEFNDRLRGALGIADVVNRRELLIAFMEHLKNEYGEDRLPMKNNYTVERFLESN